MITKSGYGTNRTNNVSSEKTQRYKKLLEEPKYSFNPEMVNSRIALSNARSYPKIVKQKETERLQEQKKDLESQLSMANAGVYSLNKASKDFATYSPKLSTQSTEQKAKYEAKAADIQKQLDSVNAKIKLNTIDEETKKYTDTNKDTFWGRAETNYDISSLQQKMGYAYSDYLDNPTEDNKKIAEAYREAIQKAQLNNPDTVGKGGWLDKSLAGYLPQLGNQFKAGGIGGTAGAVLLGGGTAAVTAFLPTVGEEVLIPKAASLGFNLGSSGAVAADTYKLMRGLAYQGLIDEGIDEETARAAAADEAFVNAAIEFASSLAGGFLLGTGKVAGKGLTTLLSKSGNKVLREAGEQALKKGTTEVAKKATVGSVAKGIGKAGLAVGIDALGEGGEEAPQQIVSIANIDRATQGKTGKLNLVSEALGKAFNLTDEEKAEVAEATIEGIKISLLTGGGTRIATDTINMAIDNNNAKRFTENGKMFKETDTVDSVIKTGLESDKNTTSYKLAKQLQEKMKSGQQVTDVELGQLFSENVKTIAQEEAIKYSPVNARQVLSQPNINVTEQGTQILPKAEQIKPKVSDKEALIAKINNNRYLNEQEKNSLIAQVQTNPYSKDLENGIQSVLKSVNEQVGLKNINNNFKENKSTYGKYANDTTEYDKSFIENAKNLIPANNSGRRTKEQWLKIADNLGSQISNMGDSEIERLAYRTWIDNKPNNPANLNRQGQKYVKFSLDEWVNSVYESARQSRENIEVEGKPLALKPSAIYVTPEGQAMTTETYSDYETGKLKLPTTKTNSVYQAAKGNVDVKIANRLMDIAEKTNVRVEGFYDENPNIEGSYKDGVIRINVNSNKAADTIFAHEFTHHLESTNAWEDVRDAIINSNTLYNMLSEKGINIDEYKQQIKDAYAKIKTKENPNGIILDDVGVEKEIVAKFVENNLMKDEKTIVRMINENPSFMQRLKNFWDDLVVRFKGTAEEKELRRIQNIYNKAFAEAKNITDFSGETQYSIVGEKGIDVTGNENLANASTVYFHTKGNGSFYVSASDSSGNTVYDGSFINLKSLQRSLGEELGQYIYDNSSAEYQEEIRVFADKKVSETDYFMAHRPTESGVYASDISEMIADVYNHPEHYYNMQKDYSKESFEALLKVRNKPEAEITIYRATPGDKFNSGDWVTLSRKYAELHNDSQLDGKGNIIEKKVRAKDLQYPGDDINEFGYFPQKDTQYSINTDNQGRKLSQQQQEFFKDNKVRDEDGNLQVAYHGTGFGFTVFDKEKAGSNYGNWGMYGKGFYFTTNKEQAKRWAESSRGDLSEVKEVYLNITNPFDPDADYTEMFADLNLDPFLTKKGYRMLEYLQEQGKDTRSILQAKGFDGIYSKYNKDNIVVFESNQIKNVDNTNPTSDPDIRYSIEIDKQTSTPKRYLSEHANTLLESGITLPETRDVIAKMIEQGTLTHERITDKDAQAYAEKYIIENGFKDAVQHWNHLIKSNREMSKEELALGQMIYNNAQQARDVNLVKKMIADLVAEGTTAGRNLQAMSMVKRLTPDGRLYALERSVQKLNQQYRDEIGKKFKDIEIPNDLAEALLKSKDQKEIDANVEKIQQYIADQIPATWKDKLNAWRYLAMLGNTSTHIRNLAGNAVFIPAIEIKNAMALVGEKTLPTAERTKAILTKKDRTLLDFAENDFNNNEPIIRGENKFDIASGVQEKRRIFDNKLLETLRQANFAALEKEDTIFLKYHYKRAMARAIKAKGLSLEQLKSGSAEMNSKLSEIRNYAINEAQKATYRDFNALAKWISNNKSRLKRNAAQSKGYKKVGYELAYAGVEGLIPFTKTPANIVKRIVEYSPVGIAKGIIDSRTSVKNGEMSASQAIDELCSGLTGTGIVGLGILLASLGFITGGGEDKQKEEQFESLKGNQNYALKIGNKTYTIDWAAPTAVPLFVGVEIFNSLKNSENADVMGSFVKIVDPVFEMSMLQGINSALSAYGSDNAIGKAVSNMFQSYLGQYVPSLFGAVARTVDPVRRTTYADKNKMLPTGLQTFTQKQLQKIPVASTMLPTYKDQFGRDSRTDNLLIRIFSNFLSPGYLAEVKDQPVENELTRIYDKTGETDVLPSYASKYITVDGEKINFTYEQYEKFATTRGDIAYKNLEKLFADARYKKLSDEEKVSAITKIYTYANEVAKSKVSDYKLTKEKARIERQGNNYYREVLK